MKKFLLLGLLPVFGFATLKMSASEQEDKLTYVVISTEYGEIKAILYDETPLHRDNFIKNVNDGIYDSLLFHRVIKNFMVQGGDPDSKNADSGVVLGNGGLPYTVPAEFNKKLFHRKGALCAAREGDEVNPLKASSSTQFYIVQGQVYTDEMLLKMETRVNQMTQSGIFIELLKMDENTDKRNRFKAAKEKNDQAEMMAVFEELKEKIKTIYLERGGDYKYSAEQREIYKTVGGAAHLDGNYTVFGEVISGMDVIEKIAEEKVDVNNRPFKDIKFSIKIVEE